MGKFTDLCQKFSTSSALNRNYVDTGRPAAEWSFITVASALATLPNVDHPGSKFPDNYRRPFVERIKQDPDRVARALWDRYTRLRIEGKGENFSSSATLDWIHLITGAVTSWENPGDQDVMQALAAVVSETYRDFFQEARSQKGGVFPGSHLPPLINLSDDQRWGPHAINGREGFDLGTAAIGIVSMPRSYNNHPLMWITVAHEVGGHSVINGMSPRHGAFWELRDVSGHLSDSITDALGISSGWVGVWQQWAEEAASDIFGFCSMGPYFSVGMAAWLSAAKATYPFGPTTVVGQLENVIHLRNGAVAGEHPPDILRIWLGLGAIDAMIDRDLPHAKAWRTLLEAIGQEALAGRETMAVYETTTGGTLLHLPLHPLLQDARRIGRHLATTPIVPRRSGGGSGIVDLVNWGVIDEALSQQVKALASMGKDGAECVPRAARSTHLIAGAMMAAYDDPSRYECLNEFLLAALGNRFKFSTFASPPTTTRAPPTPSPSKRPD